MSVSMSQADFDLLRQKGLRVVGGTLPATGRRDLPAKLRKADSISIPKVRSAVNKTTFPKKGEPTKTAVFGSYAMQPGGRKVLCLDLSMKCIGMAWGTVGQKPEGTCSYPKGRDVTEARHLLACAKTVVWEAQHHNCGFVIFSEFYASTNMKTLRGLMSLRGAVMAALAEIGIEALPVAEITARKAAGVDITKRKPEDGPKLGWMKRRVEKFFQEQGMDWPGDDEADAAVLLIGANSVIQIGD